MSLTNDTGTTMLVQPANGCYGSGGFGGFGDNSWWIILFLIFGLFGGGWGNGFGGYGGGMNGGVGSEVQRGFDHSSVIQKLDGITQGICDSTYALNNTIVNGFNGVDRSICNVGYQTQAGFNALGHQIADCCCTTQRAIDSVNYNMATQACDTRNVIQNSTRDIIDNQNAGTQAILGKLSQMEYNDLNNKYQAALTENQSLKFQASQSAQNAFITANQQAQTAELIRRLGADCPVPSYIVNPPTPVNFPVNACGNAYGYNYGNGCGCGC